MSILRLNETLLKRIKLHATTTHPEECCGVLMGGKDAEVTAVSSVLELKNTIDENRTHRFLVTADDYRMAEVAATRERVEIVGFYHSHPDHPARPSQFDLEHALPWWSYMIVSVSKGQDAAVKSWIMKDDRSAFDEETIEVLDESLKTLI